MKFASSVNLIKIFHLIRQIDSSHILVILIDESWAWNLHFIFRSLSSSFNIFHNSWIMEVGLQDDWFALHPFCGRQTFYMLANHARHVSLACTISKMAWVYRLLSLYLFHRCHSLITLPWAWDLWDLLVPFRYTQSDNTSDSPSPNSLLPFFPKYISNSYKYSDFNPQRNQNLKPYLIGLFFMYWRIRLLPLNLHMCSSIDWWDSNHIASWKCFSKWSNKGRSFHTQSYCSLSLLKKCPYSELCWFAFSSIQIE